MATRKNKAAPADGASTAGTLQAAWPFPKRAEVTDVTAKGELPANEAPAPTVDRIRVDAIDLYTDPAKNQVLRAALEQLLESPFNPRTRFDEKALQELAETVRDVGVMQPLLVRPIEIPSGWAFHRGDEPLQPYEIIFGHRRYRAARIAGLADVPVIVRDLTDAQAAQLQAIENVQRENLDPVEEARGYAHYIKVHGVSKDQLAQEIGLSRTHVYSRLKLATATPAVLEALQAGEIYEENALRIARLPHEKLQIKALEAIRKDYRYDPDDGGKRSVRRIQEFLREKFTLQLHEAIFDTKDAGLLELAGACTTCPKRSGNAPEYADLAADEERDWQKKLRAGPDLCTDPECFDAKKKAHLRNKAAELQAKGKTVVEGGKARSAIGADGRVKGAYIALKDVKAALAAKKGNKVKATELPVVTIQNPRDGKTVEAVRVEDLPATVKPKQPAAGGNNSAAENRRVAENERAAKERQLECRINKAVLVEVRQAAAGQPLTALALRLAVTVAFSGVDYDDRELLAELHGLKSDHHLEQSIETLPPDRLATLLLDCAIVKDVESGYQKPEPLLAMAKELGVDVKAIRKAIAKSAPDDKTQDLLQEPAKDEDELADA